MRFPPGKSSLHRNPPFKILQILTTGVARTAWLPEGVSHWELSHRFFNLQEICNKSTHQALIIIASNQDLHSSK